MLLYLSTYFAVSISNLCMYINAYCNAAIGEENVRAWEPLLVQLMEHYPGPCGPLRGQVWTKLCGLVGSAQLTRYLSFSIEPFLLSQQAQVLR